MPDISMCNDSTCPRSSTCYRHTANPSRYQAFFVDSPRNTDDSCDYYMPTRVARKFELNVPEFEAMKLAREQAQSEIDYLRAELESLPNMDDPIALVIRRIERMAEGSERQAKALENSWSVEDTLAHECRARAYRECVALLKGAR